MHISVKLFSVARESAGTGEMKFDLVSGATLKDALEAVYEHTPTLREVGKRSMFAIGVEYATLDTKLFDGSLISMIPPVQGG